MITRKYAFVTHELFQLPPLHQVKLKVAKNKLPSFSGNLFFLEYNRFIKKYLFEVKREICQKKYQFIERRKNVDFLKENGLTLDDMLHVLLDLSPDDYISGPEEDRDTKKGAIWKFSYMLDEIQIYIKINYNPPNDINIISFHEEE